MISVVGLGDLRDLSMVIRYPKKSVSEVYFICGTPVVKGTA